MYGTVEGLRQALVPGGEVADDSTAASMDDVSLTAHLQEASRTVDLYLARRYSLPLGEPVPGILADWAQNIAAYLATLTFRRGRDLPDTDPVVRRYRTALEALLGVQAGKGDIPGLVLVGVPGAGGVPAVFNPVGVGLAGSVYAPLGSGWHYDGRVRDGYV